MASLLATIRSFGVDAPDELMDGDYWLTCDADRLKKPADLELLKSGILEIRELPERRQLSGDSPPAIAV
jgi:hypothetical protein